MPFKWRLKKTRSYEISSKNSYIVGVYLLDNNFLECTLNSDSTGQECLDSIAQRIELSEVIHYSETWAMFAGSTFVKASQLLQPEPNVKRHAPRPMKRHTRRQTNDAVAHFYDISAYHSRLPTLYYNNIYKSLVYPPLSIFDVEEQNWSNNIFDDNCPAKIPPLI